MEEDAVAHRAPDERLAVVTGEDPPAAGRVEQQPLRATDDEVARQPDAVEREAQPPRDLELDDREVDREAHAPLEDEVEARQVGVGVHADRRPERELPVQHVVERVEDAAGAVTQVEVDPHPFGEIVQPLEAGLRVERFPSLARDQQGAEGEIDLGLRARDEPREPGAVGRAGGVEAGHPGIVAPPVRSAIAWTTARPAAR